MAKVKADMQYDVIIVGGGPAGLFSAWYLAEYSHKKVLLLEKGKGVLQRKCPIGKGKACVYCRPCNILSGIGGAGLFSDGKLNFIPILGKTDLTQFMPFHEAQALIDETETVFTAFNMDGQVFPTDREKAEVIRKNAHINGIDLLLIKQKHLGSDNLPAYIHAMMEYITKKGVEVKTSEEVVNVIVDGDRIKGLETKKGEYFAHNVILAPGRVGAEWTAGVVQSHGIEVSQRGIEIGVRVEVHNNIMKELCDIIYDPTFFVRTKKYDDQTRTFCTNYGGFVALENYQDFVCVNGHANMNIKSQNTNFAFLSKVILTEPVSDTQGYGESLGRLATIIGGGKAILQRVGDLRRGRRSTWERIRNSYIEPTMKDVVPGDIAMALPERIVTNLMEGLEKLNLVIPGVANDETLLYAPEIKFFATQVKTDNNLETAIKGLYVAGDGPGVAGNIVSASATGIIPARAIIGS